MVGSTVNIVEKDEVYKFMTIYVIKVQDDCEKRDLKVGGGVEVHRFLDGISEEPTRAAYRRARRV